MSFIDEVRADRQPLAHVLKKHLGIRKIVEELYPDRAHFIYELLQNAEDTKATDVSFVLQENQLTFEHNGRPFTDQDLWGITDIGEGTKAGDDDKIGRFGVGFKAVFAYSETPHIWSPTYSFMISELVLPSEIPSRSELGTKTRFEFPFDNPKKKSLEAFTEIKAGLEELAETTLLFLTNLQSIRWQIGSQPLGSVHRKPHSNNHIEILTQINGGPVKSSHFLRFAAPVEGVEKQILSLAYELDFLPNITSVNPAQPLSNQLRIIPANPGRVAVFFPAEKESSSLRFHLHAPFVPELSRASIKETPANETLFAQLAKMAASSLHEIRSLGLLNGEFLGVLPNLQDNLPPRYQPIRDAIISAMKSQPLTPTHHKAHAPAKYLKQSKATVKELLSLNDIEFLIDYQDEPPQWAIAAPQKNSNADRFLSSLAIADWGILNLVEVLKQKLTLNGNQKPDPQFVEWLKSKNTEWHQELYSLLQREVTDNYDSKAFDDLQIARLGTGDYSIGHHCFFPTAKVDHDEKFPRVARATYTSGKSTTQQEEARKFLISIGVREVGETEQVEAVLKERYDKTNHKASMDDFPRWVALVEKDPDNAKMFRNYFIFQREDGKWGRPDQVFLDQPFLQTGLSIYYNALAATTGVADPAQPRALATAYEQSEISATRLVSFAKAVGVKTKLESVNDLSRILPHIQTSIQALKPDMAAIGFVWRMLCEFGKNNSHILEDSSSYHKGWGHYGTVYHSSHLCYELRKQSWIPQQTTTGMKFLSPLEASRELLPDGFPFDSGWHWLKLLGFGERASKIVQEQQQKEVEATAIGFPDAKSLDRARQFAALPPDVQERFLAERLNPKSTELPDKESRNPDLRADRVSKGAKDAPGRNTEKRLRTVSIGLGEIKDQCEQYLRHQYTNTDDEMICQICQAALPFKVAGGAYYFEKVEFLDTLKNRHYQNYLSLCPNHSAMFQYANDSQSKLKELFLAMTGQRLDVILAQANFSIYFTKIHIGDLKQVIQIDAASGSASVPTAKRLPNGMEECPYCHSPVRPDRLQSHIARVHSSGNRNLVSQVKLPPQIKESPTAFQKCRSCGKPTVPGEDYCYSCG